MLADHSVITPGATKMSSPADINHVLCKVWVVYTGNQPDVGAVSVRGATSFSQFHKVAHFYAHILNM